MSRHVFVESNWVVDHAAPMLSSSRAADELFARAQRGEITLHVPSICLVEARKVVRERTVRVPLNAIRDFVKRSRDSGTTADADADVAFGVLSRFEAFEAREKREAPTRISELIRNEAIDVFSLDEEMLAQTTELAAIATLDLRPFDTGIIAAVLVAGARLHEAGESVSFCTLDTDLQPWGKRGERRSDLADLYDAHGIWVYGDFLLEWPAPPDPWPP